MKEPNFVFGGKGDMLAGFVECLCFLLEAGTYREAEVASMLHERNLGLGECVVGINGPVLRQYVVSLGERSTLIFGLGDCFIEKSILLLTEK